MLCKYFSFVEEKVSNSVRILFMREYPIISSAATVEQLSKSLKEGQLEQYGEAFKPENVYSVINRLPRFSSMTVSGITNAPIFFTDRL